MKKSKTKASKKAEKKKKLVDSSADYKKGKGELVKRWCLTINNPKLSDEEMKNYLINLPDIKYGCFQREKGHLTGTIHLQMFLIFKVSKRFSAMKKLFPDAHIEATIGTNVEARDYCKKSDTKIGEFIEVGEFSEVRARNDIKNFFELIKSGASDSDIQELCPSLYLRYSKSIDSFRQEMLYKENSSMFKKDFIVIYIYGTSGVGKTYSIFTEFGNRACYISNYEKNPFDNYRNEDIVVFDEFRSQVNFSAMLRYLDVYPVYLPRRFNDKYGNYTKVFILSNQPPDTQYSYQKTNDYASWMGFRRRITFSLYFKSREQIIVEKAEKPIEELIKVLPKNMIDILQTTSGEKISKESSIDNKVQVKMFEELPDVDLIF